MTEIATLKIRVDALEAKAATDALNKMAPAAKGAEKATGGLTSSVRGLNKVLGVAVGYLSARQVLQAAESWTTLNNRLRLVTDGAQEFAQAQQSIFDIAQETRQPLTATAELYQRIAANQKELNLTGKETAGIVETINKALVISGTAGAGAEAALVQLGQAFASGTLRGEELNAVLEQAPALAQAIARGMGVTVGELRQLGADGALTAESVVAALQQQEQAITSLFESMAPTVSGALTQVENSFIQLVGKMDDGTQASQSAAAAIGELAAIMSDPKTIEAANNLAAGIATAFASIVKTSREVVGTVQWMAEEAAAFMSGPALGDIVRIEDHLDALAKKADQIQRSGAPIPDWLTKDIDKYSAMLEMSYGMAGTAPPLVVTQGSPATPAKTASAPIARTSTSAQKDKGPDELARLTEQLMTEEEAIQSSYEKRRAIVLANTQAGSAQQIDLMRRVEMERVASLARIEEAEAAEQERKNLAAQSVVESMMTEEEQLRLAYERKKQIILESTLYTEQEKQRIILEAEQQTNDQIAQMEAMRTSATLNNYAQMFDGIAGFAKTFAGEQSGIYKAMFAVSKAFAIADSIIKIQQGIASAAAIPFPANLAAMATVAASTGSIISTISGTNLSFDGGGYTGDGARSGGMDGKGGFMAMLHPQETVVDHTKGQSAGGVTINVIESAEKAGTQQKRQNADGTESVDVFVSDIYGDGPRARALQNAFGLKRSGK